MWLIWMEHVLEFLYGGKFSGWNPLLSTSSWDVLSWVLCLRRVLGRCCSSSSSCFFPHHTLLGFALNISKTVLLGLCHMVSVFFQKFLAKTSPKVLDESKNAALFTKMGERRWGIEKKTRKGGGNWVIAACFQATGGTLGSQTIAELPSSVGMSQCLSRINVLKAGKMQEQDPGLHQGKLSFLTLALAFYYSSAVRYKVDDPKKSNSCAVHLSLLVTEHAVC